MPKGNRRAISAMAQGAIAQQKDAEIEALREQLSQLNQVIEQNHVNHRAVEIPVQQVLPLQIRSNLEDGELIHQPRTYFDPAGLEDLRNSIRANGLKEPIIVRTLADGGYGLLDGERRWRCHRELGEESIRAIVLTGLSDLDALEWAITTDTLKEKVSPLEQTISVVNLLRLRLGLGESEVRAALHALNNYEIGNSNSLGITPGAQTMIRGVLNSLGLKLGSLVARLPLLDLPSYLRVAVAAGQLSPTNALLIHRTPMELHQSLLKDGIGLSKSNLKKLIAQRQAEWQAVPSEQDVLSKSVEIEGQSLPQRVGDRWAKIKRSKLVKAGQDQQLKRKLKKLDTLLAEIESYITEQESST
jgi:ParB family chromosome partitioning protein